MKKLIAISLLTITLIIMGCTGGDNTIIKPSDKSFGRKVHLEGWFEEVIPNEYIHLAGYTGKENFDVAIIRTEDRQTKQPHWYQCHFYGGFDYKLRYNDPVEFRGYVLSETNPDFTLLDHCKFIKW